MNPQILLQAPTGSTSTDALRLLGSFAINGFAGKPGKRADRDSISEARAQLEAAVEIAEDWPRNFFLALERHRIRPADGGTVQLLSQAFPRATKWLGQIPDAGLRSRIGDALEDYCHGPGGARTPILSRRSNSDRRPLTLKIVAGQLGHRVESVARVIDIRTDLISVARTTATGRKRRVVYKSDLPQLSEQLADRLTRKGAARMTALPVSRLQALVRSDLLHEDSGKLRRAQLHALNNGLLGKVCLDVEATGQTLSVRETLRNWVQVTRTSDFVQALLAGQLPAWRTDDSVPIGNWIVRRLDVQAWVNCNRPSPSDVLTLQDAALELSVKHDVVRDLIRTGLLPAQQGVINGRRSWCVVSTELTAFQARYVALAEVARLASVRLRDGLAWAQSRGHHVVTGPCVDGSRQYFVKRST